tara:strand:- start:1581 stop:1883 length:303 start_codon:yes stop_codon:yes gene_type:complete
MSDSSNSNKDKSIAKTPFHLNSIKKTSVSKDMVNSPSHYTSGRVEAIEIIEDATKDAPSVIAGVYHANVLKYLLRLWYKSKSKEDAQKAQWYLKKLIDLL